MTQLLFSYGTLQLEKVQKDTYGRLLNGIPDILEGYKIEQLEITDKDVLSKSRQKYHPIAVKTGNKNDRIKGVIFEITDEELQQTDEYEVSDYQRISETFKSGRNAWVYVKNRK